MFNIFAIKVRLIAALLRNIGGEPPRPFANLHPCLFILFSELEAIYHCCNV